MSEKIIATTARKPINFSGALYKKGDPIELPESEYKGLLKIEAVAESDTEAKSKADPVLDRKKELEKLTVDILQKEAAALEIDTKALKKDELIAEILKVEFKEQ
ncbi:MAG: hypothetical protein WA118_08285 [Carboxydocellales bacterium]